MRPALKSFGPPIGPWRNSDRAKVGFRLHYTSLRNSFKSCQQLFSSFKRTHKNAIFIHTARQFIRSRHFLAEFHALRIIFAHRS
jgi:hypothetical protein